MREEKLFEKFGVKRIINGLTPFLTDQRCARIDRLLKSRIGSVHVAAESPADLHNAFAMVRTAEALGVCHFHLIGQERKGRMGRQTMRGTERWMHLRLHTEFDDFIADTKGISLIGATPRAELTLEQVPIDRPICLI
ncbi:MAG: TrmH family RNA methyltransferase, partial [Waddliaceae bacterium]